MSEEEGVVFTANLFCLFFFFGSQAIQQQSSSETEVERNTADGSSEGEEGDSVKEEDDKEKLKGDKMGSKRKKIATTKVTVLLEVLFTNKQQANEVIT